MMRKSSSTALMLAFSLVCLMQQGNCSSVITLEHSFDGHNFHPFASLDLPSMTGGAVPLTSLAEASSSPASKFAEAVNSGDLYYIRALQTGSPVAPVASIPSRCWATAAASAQLHLHTLDNGALTAVSFLAPCSTSSAAVADVNALSVPTINVVHVVRPQLAPELSMPAPTGALPQQQQQQTQPTTEKGGTDDDGGAPPPPPKDDRTWLQKNWLPVALVAFMFANRLGQAAPPPPQAPASGRR